VFDDDDDDDDDDDGGDDDIVDDDKHYAMRFEGPHARRDDFIAALHKSAAAHGGRIACLHTSKIEEQIWLGEPRGFILTHGAHLCSEPMYDAEHRWFRNWQRLLELTLALFTATGRFLPAYVVLEIADVMRAMRRVDKVELIEGVIDSARKQLAARSTVTTLAE
jgi:hypothetical protein